MTKRLTNYKYPENIIQRGDRAVGYFTACLRAGVDVTRKLLNSEEYKEVHGYDEIPVNMEYPQENQHYPYVQVMYQNSKFYPSTLEERAHYDPDDPDSVEDKASHYLFEGSYIISVYANTILERETICDCLIGMMGIDESYRMGFYDTPYVNVSPNMHTLSSPTANESVGTPWDADALTCYRQFRFDVRGDFLYRVGTPAVYIENIEIIGNIENGDDDDSIHARLPVDRGEG